MSEITYHITDNNELLITGFRKKYENVVKQEIGGRWNSKLNGWKTVIGNEDKVKKLIEELKLVGYNPLVYMKNKRKKLKLDSQNTTKETSMDKNENKLLPSKKVEDVEETEKVQVEDNSNTNDNNNLRNKIITNIVNEIKKNESKKIDSKKSEPKIESKKIETKNNNIRSETELKQIKNNNTKTKNKKEIETEDESEMENEDESDSESYSSSNSENELSRRKEPSPPLVKKVIGNSKYKPEPKHKPEYKNPLSMYKIFDKNPERFRQEYFSSSSSSSKSDEDSYSESSDDFPDPSTPKKKSKQIDNKELSNKLKELSKRLTQLEIKSYTKR